jgi:hypothetical protein
MAANEPRGACYEYLLCHCVLQGKTIMVIAAATGIDEHGWPKRAEIIDHDVVK